MGESFYLPLGGERYRATWHTTGPWEEGLQHGGPPSALLGRAVEQYASRRELVVARVTVEILGPVPVAQVDVRSRILRSGRNVELVEASMTAGTRAVARASVWRVRRTSSDPVAPRQPVPPPLAGTSAAAPPDGWVDGYLSAIEWHPVRGGLGVPGPATVWTRLAVPLLPDEEPSPLQRVLAVADSGNGAASELDLRRWLFINPELTVHLHREAVGEWICLDAATAVSTGGAGLTTSTLSDQRGPLGVGAQSLLVAPRPDAPSSPGT